MINIKNKFCFKQQIADQGFQVAALLLKCGGPLDSDRVLARLSLLFMRLRFVQNLHANRWLCLTYKHN